jgi:hypothetical protein
MSGRDDEATYHLYLLPGVFFRPNGPGGWWSGTDSAYGGGLPEWEHLGGGLSADAVERWALLASARGLVRVYEVRAGINRIEYLSEWVDGDALAHEGYDGIDPGPLSVAPDDGGPCVVVRGLDGR